MMGLPLNPVEVYKAWRERKKDSRQSFIEWVNSAQRELKTFIGVWTKLADHVEDMNGFIQSLDGVERAWLGELTHTLNAQSMSCLYIDEFYKTASAAANGRVGDDILERLTSSFAFVLQARNKARRELNPLVKRVMSHSNIFFLDPSNRAGDIETVRDSIRALQKEAVVLDVFFDRIKANPDAFR